MNEYMGYKIEYRVGAHAFLVEAIATRDGWPTFKRSGAMKDDAFDKIRRAIFHEVRMRERRWADG